MRPLTALTLVLFTAAPVCSDPADTDASTDTDPSDSDSDVTDDDDTSDTDTDFRDDPQGPVAVCFAIPDRWNPTQGAPVRLDATASFGIGLNNLVAWDWDVIRAPSGSEAEPIVQGPGLHDFDPDRAGTYELHLTVTDEHGAVSEPCSVQVDAFFTEPTVDCRVSEQPTTSIDGQLTAVVSDSYPPFTYRWSILDDSTSTATLATPEANETAITATATGSVQTRVVVTNAVGAQSEPCDLVVPVIDGPPPANVEFRLTWSHVGDDLDLHLVREPGALRTAEDCYYANCREGLLDWGELGVAEDNPVMLVDDIAGVGPEIIAVEQVSSLEETWRVVVNDYPGSRRDEPTQATVSILVDGLTVYQTQFTMVGEDDDVPVARFTSPSFIVEDILPNQL